VTANCPYPEPEQSNSCPPHSTSWTSIYFIKIFLFTLLSSRFLLSFRTPSPPPSKPCMHLSSLPYVYMPCPSYSAWIDQLNNIWWLVQITKLLFSCLHSPVTSSLLGPNIFLSTLFSNVFGLSFSLSVRDQVSNTYKNTDKFIFPRILIFVFNPLNAELNPICNFLALLGAHHILHVNRIRVKESKLEDKTFCYER